jgi:hypothetical protein
LLEEYFHVCRLSLALSVSKHFCARASLASICLPGSPLLATERMADNGFPHDSAKKNRIDVGFGNSLKYYNFRARMTQNQNFIVTHRLHASARIQQTHSVIFVRVVRIHAVLTRGWTSPVIFVSGKFFKRGSSRHARG